jgi:maltooligosyltrehalose trehalohydrolase
VTQGRRAEFAHFAAFADPAARARIPDPNDPQTFEKSVLRRDEAGHSPHRERREWIGRLLALRHRHLLPRLPHFTQGGRHALMQGVLLDVAWTLTGGGHWRLQAHFGDADMEAPLPHAGELVFSDGVQESGAGHARYSPNAVRVWSSAADD